MIDYQSNLDPVDPRVRQAASAWMLLLWGWTCVLLSIWSIAIHFAPHHRPNRTGGYTVTGALAYAADLTFRRLDLAAALTLLAVGAFLASPLLMRLRRAKHSRWAAVGAALALLIWLGLWLLFPASEGWRRRASLTGFQVGVTLSAAAVVLHPANGGRDRAISLFRHRRDFTILLFAEGFLLGASAGFVCWRFLRWFFPSGPDFSTYGQDMILLFLLPVFVISGVIVGISAAKSIVASVERVRARL